MAVLKPPEFQLGLEVVRDSHEFEKIRRKKSTFFVTLEDEKKGEM